MLGGRSGDLYVLVHVRRDERLVRDGNDILSALDLTMTQAALGGDVHRADARRRATSST